MVDVVDPATRSRMMSGIRGKDTIPEMLVRRFLHARGFRYRLHIKTLPGTPDLVLRKYRAVIFVHGCFWHRHPGCPKAAKPKSNIRFWKDKLEGNAARDRKNIAALKKLGWRCLIVWECQATKGPRLRRLADTLKRSGNTA